MKSNACENRAAQQPHTIDWCSGQLLPHWQQTRFYWKDHLQTQGNIFLSPWPLHLSCEWSCGLTGLSTLGWARMALCQGLPKLPEKNPQTHHQSLSAPQWRCSGLGTPLLTSQSKPLPFTKSDDKKKIKSPVKGLSHLLSLSMFATYRWAHCKQIIPPKRSTRFTCSSLDLGRAGPHPPSLCLFSFLKLGMGSQCYFWLFFFFNLQTYKYFSKSTSTYTL